MNALEVAMTLCMILDSALLAASRKSKRAGEGRCEMMVHHQVAEIEKVPDALIFDS